MPPLIQIQDIRKSFDGQEILAGIDLEIDEGETVVVIGASGSGKTTLLRCINFLEIPSAGRVIFRGQPVGDAGKNGIRYRAKDLAAYRSRVGMVFQRFNLFPHMTALQNVMEGLVSVRKMHKPLAEKAARSQLDKVGLSDKADQYPARLSGGQQQRVAIARALAMEPEMMLFDEATSALDPELVGEVLRVMRSLSQSGMTMLIVTHEMAFARAVADRVIFLHNGEIHEQGSAAAVLEHPSSERTRRFLRGLDH